MVNVSSTEMPSHINWDIRPPEARDGLHFLGRISVGDVAYDLRHETNGDDTLTHSGYHFSLRGSCEERHATPCNIGVLPWLKKKTRTLAPPGKGILYGCARGYDPTSVTWVSREVGGLEISTTVNGNGERHLTYARDGEVLYEREDRVDPGPLLTLAKRTIERIEHPDEEQFGPSAYTLDLFLPAQVASALRTFPCEAKQAEPGLYVLEH